MPIRTRIWKIIRWPLLALLIWYIVAVAVNIPWPVSKEKTDAAVAAIHAQRLTMADVDGSNLPPPPDPKLVNATTEGIDANKNGIRDDVELAIFKKYPTSIKIRAAELQYAMELQMELSRVLNSETLIAVLEEGDRGYRCVSDTASDRQTRKARLSETETFVFNSEERRQARERAFEFMTSRSSSNDVDCDIEPATLIN